MSKVIEDIRQIELDAHGRITVGDAELQSLLNYQPIAGGHSNRRCANDSSACGGATNGSCANRPGFCSGSSNGACNPTPIDRPPIEN